MRSKILSNELINENKPDIRIVWVHDLWNVLGLNNFVYVAYEPVWFVRCMKKQMFSSYHFCHVYYVRISLVNGKVCM